MLIKRPPDIRTSEITNESLYLQRRDFLKRTAVLGAGAAGLILSGNAQAEDSDSLKVSKRSVFSTTEEQTPFAKIASYTNFYEFSTDKQTPTKIAHTLTTEPWSLTIEGAVEKPGVYQLEDIFKPHALEERIYRLRCVEGWSMVVPWVGFSLADLIKRFSPTANAKYVEFTTLYRPEEMPGQKRDVLSWPYIEGLRMDEAMHPLTLLAVGLYGKTLPNQNGAPLRLVVPWKYGFKSIKSIVKIRFLEQQPVSTWTKASPREYGFYSNVNPAVAHPRWTQKRERRIGEFLKRKTLMFNGYAEEVAHLYAGMDLRKHF